MDSTRFDGVFSPTPEDYTRMWEEKHLQKQLAKNTMSSDQAKRAAVKEVLKEQVKRQTTPEKRLSDAFSETINRLKG